MVNRRDTVMIRMLYACCKSLSERDMAGVLIDGVKSGEHGFEALGERQKSCCRHPKVTDKKAGFQKWAEYREVWKTL